MAKQKFPKPSMLTPGSKAAKSIKQKVPGSKSIRTKGAMPSSGAASNARKGPSGPLKSFKGK